MVVDGYERMLLLYLSICSWNTDSIFRTTTANGIFTPQNSERIATTAESDKLDMIEEGWICKKCKSQKMLIHSAYLGIPSTHYDSGNELTEKKKKKKKKKELRTEYRKEASKTLKGLLKATE